MINIEKFKALYQEAVETKSPTFFYEGQEVMTKYAQYLIDFLEAQTHQPHFYAN